jgi:hypothetical protein
MVAVTAALTKLPLRGAVKGKAILARKGPGVPDASLWGGHTKTGWVNAVAMMRWIQRLCDLPQYAEGHKLHLIVDTYAVHPCQEVRNLAGSLNMESHFIPAGPADTMHPPDRCVLEAMKARYRRIYQARVAGGGIRRLASWDLDCQLRATWEDVSRAIRERARAINETE